MNAARFNGPPTMRFAHNPKTCTAHGHGTERGRIGPMKNRRTFGGGNGGIWMLRKRRKVVQSFDHQPIKISTLACQEEEDDDDKMTSIYSSDDDDFFCPVEDENEALSPIEKNVVQRVQSPATTLHTERRPIGGAKRGTFGSRKRNMLTDSEISKKIRVALSSQSSVVVSSDEEEQSSHPQSPKKLLCEPRNAADSAAPIPQGEQALSSQSSQGSNLSFRAGSQCLHPSLEAARSFFAEIDNMPLTTEDAERNPSAKKTVKLRTRRCKLPKQALDSEYAKYCDACGDIKPLSIECFVEQRAKYFRRSEVFEGMFDE